MTKIDIISGFLGAGKTTLIKRLLADALKERTGRSDRERVRRDRHRRRLPQGRRHRCQRDERRLHLLLARRRLRQRRCTTLLTSITRTASSSSRPASASSPDVIAAVQNAHLDVQLNSFVTVVDALKAKMYLKNFGEFFENQVAHAGAILLSRTAECPEKASTRPSPCCAA